MRAPLRAPCLLPFYLMLLTRWCADNHVCVLKNCTLCKRIKRIAVRNGALVRSGAAARCLV